MSTRPPRPEVAPAASWHFPTPRMRTLENGLQVWIFQLPGQHVVSVELSLDVPLAVEPREKEGVALMALRVSDEGTLAHPGAELQELLESCGAAYQGGAGAFATHCSLDVPAPRLARAMELFAEIVRTPAYAEADVQRHLTLRLTEIEQARISPGALAATAVRKVHYSAEDRASRPPGGTEQTISSLSAADVRDFHRQWWRPAGAVLVIAGDLPDDVDDLVDATFGDWAGPDSCAPHESPATSAEPTTEDGRQVVHLVDRPGAVQAELRLFGESVGRASELFAPLQVATTVMGGSFGSRLNHLLREERGFTYGVSMSTAPGRDTDGQWTMGGSFRTEVAADALDDALATLSDGEAFTTEEVADAVNYQVGIAPLRYATAGGVAGQAISLASVGRTPEYVNEHFARVRAVTPETATDAFNRIVPEQVHVVVVGDASELRPALTEHGYPVRDLGVLTD